LICVDIEARVKNRVPINGARFEPGLFVRPGKSSRMRELQADEQVVGAAEVLLVSRNQQRAE